MHWCHGVIPNPVDMAVAHDTGNTLIQAIQSTTEELASSGVHLLVLAVVHRTNDGSEGVAN